MFVVAVGLVTESDSLDDACLNKMLTLMMRVWGGKHSKKIFKRVGIDGFIKGNILW